MTLPAFLRQKKRGLAMALAFLVLPPAVLLLYAMSPAGGDTVQVVEIPKGASFSRAVDLLEAEGLVRQRQLFYAVALLKNAARHIKAGEYEFSGALSPLEILEKLTRGDVIGYTITVPEGYTVRQILDRLLENKLVDEKEFLRLNADRAFLSSLRISGGSLEGYLFPETYRLDRSMGTRAVIRAMVDQFWHRLTPEMTRRAGERGLEIHELVTLASIIEKETGLKAEMPLISAVFHNRLRQRMPLQSDPTVIYGIENFDGNLRKPDLLKKTPYNTYLIPGLPPGPIASPGTDALNAALHPAEVDYLYFVSKNDGSHHFSNHLSQHNAAVAAYQLRKKRP